jgi:hypothetical protein
MSFAFHKPNIAEVKALIQKELKDLPLGSLSIHVGENQSLSPIYTNSNKCHKIPYLLDYKVIFQLFSLTCAQAETNNRNLLEALENGQNGLILDFKHEDWKLDNLNQLFLNIRLDYIHTEFLNLNNRD